MNITHIFLCDMKFATWKNDLKQFLLTDLFKESSNIALVKYIFIIVSLEIFCFPI